jgi:hypothetical protein
MFHFHSLKKATRAWVAFLFDRTAINQQPPTELQKFLPAVERRKGNLATL